MFAAVAVVYGLLLFVALLNALLMVRPSTPSDPIPPILIPARNEADNLARLVPTLIAQAAEVVVFDDGSTDDSARVAEQAGANVLRGPTDPPPGWTGKNRACHELANRALTADLEWIVFLDADMEPSPDFMTRFAGLLQDVGEQVAVVSGFPTMKPGRGLEPLYTSWVPWILLASNPFGLVSRTGKGHNRFTNGQIVAWRSSAYRELQPNEAVRDRILEDVLIGRLLAARGLRVEVADLSGILATRMYPTLGAAIDGMSKNSFEIVGSVWASVAMAAGLLFLAWGWAICGDLWWVALGLLLAGKFVTDRLVRSAWWTFPLAPITLTLAALTFLRSMVWHRTGRVRWKGRTYGRR